MKKRTLVALALAIAGQVRALTLYDITVTVQPKINHATILIYNLAPGLSKKYSCLKNNVGSATCRLPAGKYKIGAADNEDTLTYVDRTVEVKANSRFTLQLAVQHYTPMPIEAVKAFNQLLIPVNGIINKCGRSTPRPDERCATTTSPLEAFQTYARITPGLRQTTAWSKFTNQNYPAYNANFEVAGKSYLMVVTDEGDQLYIFWR